MSKKRVVVTGMGIVSPIGNNILQNWNNIINGNSGINKTSLINVENINCKISGEITSLNIEDHISSKDMRKMDRFIQLGLIAAKEAIADAGLIDANDQIKDRCGVIVGSGIGGLSSIENTSVNYHCNNKRVSPYFIPASLINLLSGHIAATYGYTGINSAVSTACASGLHSIGDGTRVIQYGDADVMIVGGAEAPITPVGVAGFAAARSLAVNYNDNPKEASRPWDKDRSGFVMSEGSGILVLEEYEHAKKRNAKIYAEVIGYGCGADAYHITAPNGVGATKSMSNALKDANIAAEQIDYINAHGTSTIIGDEVELRAVEKLFANNKSLFMSSTKSITGHLLGAAGSVEAIYSILSINNNILPPTINLHNQIDVNDNINLVANKSIESKNHITMCNSFGFGGTNATVIFSGV